ncbi:MAG: hypothetical protein CVU33_03985 [Betaproteobacteria bacterium HGW-Betaproteobacteria-6]|jgi:hypothetical protein|nr:MAG: hypothetical protein CVU33_03985 [Betaproteobacteria bacterium HGW-Betaproteobacteria-6]
MWPSLFKIVGGSLVAVALLWALVLGWWQSNDYEPSRLDLALYLGALPLAIVGGYFLLKGFIEHLKAPPAAEVPKDKPLADLDPLAIAAAKTSAAERLFSIDLLNAFVVTAAGSDSESIFAAIKDGVRPLPNPSFTDSDGFPVFLAEVKNLDHSMIAEEFEGEKRVAELLEARNDVRRAITLLASVVDQASEVLSGYLNQPQKQPLLNVLWLIPSNWNGLEAAALKTWLKTRYWSDLSESCLSIKIAPVSHETMALKHLDEIILDANRDSARSVMTLILGMMSSIDGNIVEMLDANGGLFSAKRQDQSVPGEGAVALLLGHEAALGIDERGQATILSRVALGGRDKPLSSGGRIRGKTVEQLISGLLDVTAVEHSAITAVVADTDHRADHLTEILDGLGTAFAHLDPIEDCSAIGTSCGALPPISGLVALACAHAKALADDAHVLLISNQHPTERAVLLVSPPLAQASTLNPANT